MSSILYPAVGFVGAAIGGYCVKKMCDYCSNSQTNSSNLDETQQNDETQEAINLPRLKDINDTAQLSLSQASSPTNEVQENIDHSKLEEINNKAEELLEIKNNKSTDRDRLFSFLDKLRELPPNHAPYLSDDVIKLNFINEECNSHLLASLTYDQFLLLSPENQISCFQAKLQTAKSKEDIQPFFQFLTEKTPTSELLGKWDEDVENYQKALDLDLNIMVSEENIWETLPQNYQDKCLAEGKVGGKVLRNLNAEQIKKLPKNNSLQAIKDSNNYELQSFAGNKRSYKVNKLDEKHKQWAKNTLNQHTWNQNKKLAIYAISDGIMHEWDGLKSIDDFTVPLFQNNDRQKTTLKINEFVAHRMAKMSQDYNIIVVQMSKCDSMVKDIKSIRKLTDKQIAVLTKHGHGSEREISFAPNYVDNAHQVRRDKYQTTIGGNDFMHYDSYETKITILLMSNIATLEEDLAPDAVIDLQACKTGKPRKNNKPCIARKYAEIYPGRTILAPSENYSDKDWIITSTMPYNASCCVDGQEVMKTFYVEKTD